MRLKRLRSGELIREVSKREGDPSFVYVATGVVFDDVFAVQPDREALHDITPTSEASETDRKEAA
jgi:hypothetical protein